MRKFNIALTLGACAVALAACGGKDEAKTEAAPEATAVAAATPTGPAPSPKAGLWENTTTVQGQPAMTVKVCMGEENKDTLSAMGAPEGEACSERKVEPAAGGYAIALTCKFQGAGEMKTTGKISGDLSSNFTAETTTTITAEGKSQTATMSYSGKYLGPCPEGMPPGSVDTGSMIIDSSGMKK